MTEIPTPTAQRPEAGPAASPHTNAQPLLDALIPYMKPHTGRSLLQLANTALPFAALWYLMYRSLVYPYWVTLLLALPAAGLVIRLFIIQHDCGHGAFFARQKANNALGFVLGVVTLTPYEYWRRTHAIHHATSGNLDRRDFGEITTLTVREYTALPAWRRWVYRLYRNPLVLFLLGPAYVFLLKQRLPLDLPWSWKREWRSILWTNLCLAGVALWAWQTIGIVALLKIQLPITLISGSAGVWLFYIQHQFEDTYWEWLPDWDYEKAGLKGSSYYDLPRIVNWFTGNIGVHHVHHLCSRIPNYRLHECLRAHPALQEATRLRLTDGWDCVHLKLWDEDSGRLVGYPRT